MVGTYIYEACSQRVEYCLQNQITAWSSRWSLGVPSMLGTYYGPPHRVRWRRQARLRLDGSPHPRLDMIWNSTSPWGRGEGWFRANLRFAAVNDGGCRAR